MKYYIVWHVVYHWFSLSNFVSYSVSLKTFKNYKILVMKRILLIIVFCVSFLTLEAQTITWTGAGDGTNWSDFNNWDLSILPTDSHNVIIPDGSTVTIDEEAYGNSIEVQGASTLTINSTLQIYGNSLFSEKTLVNWRYGGLGKPLESSQGNGILTNYGTINIDRPEPSFNTPLIFNITFNNEGTINFINGSLIVGTGSVLNNQSEGVIDFGEVSFALGNDYGWALCCGFIINWGTIQKINGDDVTSNEVGVYNYGVIEAISGTIKFYGNYYSHFNNSPEGIINGIGAIDFSELTNYSNAGTFSPGASPGVLTFIGDFNSSSSSKLAVELNGLTQGVDYDLLEIQGDAILDGIVEVTMGFEGAINDEFVVAITTGTITSCNLVPTATAEFNGKNYFFDVACNSNKQVVLTISNITLGLESSEFIEKNIQIFPNPANLQFKIRNNSDYLLKNALLIDINGRVIEDINLDSAAIDNTISLLNYRPGLYFIKICANNNQIIKKIIKM
jgi:hypothetical protein